MRERLCRFSKRPTATTMCVLDSSICPSTNRSSGTQDKNLGLYQARIKNSANVAPYDSTIPLITWTAVHHGKWVITKFHPKTTLATFWDR